MSNLFIGEHSTISINMDLIEFVAASAFAGSDEPTTVHMQSGKKIVLTHGNKTMFAAAWERYWKAKAAGDAPVTPTQEAGTKKRYVTAITFEDRSRSGGMAAYCACNDGTFWQYTRYNNYHAEPGESQVSEEWFLMNPIPQVAMQDVGMPDVPQDDPT